MLWKQRNKTIFHNRNYSSNLAAQITSQASDFYWCATDWRVANSFILKDIRWERPRSNWSKLNTDGSSMGNPGLAGGGVVIRDEMGNWMVGFSTITSSFEAELWALRDGLSICVERSSPSIEVELDAKAIIDILVQPTKSNSLVSLLLDDCRQLTSQIPQILFKHCYREANRVADHLARNRAKQNADFILFENPPVDLLAIFNSDLAG